MPQVQRQLLNVPPEADDEARGRCRWRTITWIITALCFGLFAFNCAVAVHHRSRLRGVAVCSFLDFLALVVCLNRYEKAEPGSEPRDRQKVSACLLTAALGSLFTYQVSTVTAPAVAVVVCLLAFGVVARAFYYL